MSALPNSLLAADEPAPVTVHNENGPSPFLIVADHAGNSIPRALGRLGLPESECEAHIAWDIGIAAVSRLVADALDATLVQQNAFVEIALRRLHLDRLDNLSLGWQLSGNLGLGPAQQERPNAARQQPAAIGIAPLLDRRTPLPIETLPVAKKAGA